MFELFEMGIEMQKRMIAVHEQGIKATQDMLTAAGKQADMAKAINQASKAQAEFIEGWWKLWGGRR